MVQQAKDVKQWVCEVICPKKTSEARSQNTFENTSLGENGTESVGM